MVRRLRSNSIFIASALVFPLVFGVMDVYAEGTISVEVKNGRINLFAEDRSFGEVLDALAKSVKFTVKVPQGLRAKRISITLHDKDIDGAVVRLFSLVQEKNYKVKYNSSGDIMKIEVITGKSRMIPGRMAGDNKNLRGKKSIRRDKTRRYNPKRVPRRYRPQSVQPKVGEAVETSEPAIEKEMSPEKPQ